MLPGKQHRSHPGHPRGGHGFGAQLCPAEQLPRVSLQLLPDTPPGFAFLPGPTLQEVSQHSSTALSFHTGHCLKAYSCPGGGRYHSNLHAETGPTPETPYQRVDGYVMPITDTHTVIPIMCTRSGGIMRAGQRTWNACTHSQAPCALGTEPM